MSLWTSAEIAEATGGTASADFAVDGVTFDSREVGRGDLFIAMVGEAMDGHRFVDAAIAAGAAGVLVDREVPHPHVRVADTMAALEALGRAARARCAATVIGVTGSVGKTGTKEALAAALDRDAPGEVHRSVKSYNNHTGVPLSLARMPRDCRYAVLEMGMNHTGEIAALTRMVRPHVALITAIAPAHIENLGSIEGIADAKAEVFEGLGPGGVAVLPHDSAQYPRLRARAEALGVRCVSFGTGAGADVRALDWVADPDSGGSLVTAKVHDATLCFALSQPGDHWVSNAMAVLAAVEAAGADLNAAGVALADLPGMAGRGARHRLRVVGGEALLIDESYNANPASMAATLDILRRSKGARRLAVLGAMKELGEQGAALHAALAEPIVAAHVDRLWLVGDEMAPLADELAKLPLEQRPDFDHGRDVDSVLAALRETLRPDDVLLIKGSNSVGLGRLVTALIGEEG